MCLFPGHNGIEVKNAWPETNWPCGSMEILNDIYTPPGRTRQARKFMRFRHLARVQRAMGGFGPAVMACADSAEMAAQKLVGPCHVFAEGRGHDRLPIKMAWSTPPAPAGSARPLELSYCCRAKPDYGANPTFSLPCTRLRHPSKAHCHFAPATGGP